MRGFAKCAGTIVVVLLAAYVGSFLALVEVGKGYARRRGVPHAYFLADPDDDPGYARHYSRGRFYVPLVHITQHWTGGPHVVFP